MDRKIVEGFTSLFKGRTDAWGKVEGGCVREALTPEHYRLHIEGKTSLGIYPLLPSSDVNFLAIDVDLANFQVALNIRNKFKENNLNSYIEGLTKRGRYHVWLFFSEPVPAWKARDIAIRVIKELGYDNIEELKKLDPSNPNPHVEIFPKQDEAAEVEFGNYINLPYFGNTRTILTIDQRPVPLDYFLEHVRKNTSEKLDEALEAKGEEEMSTPKGTPEEVVGLLPCAKLFMEKGAAEGNRDESLFRFAIHLKSLKFPREAVEDIVAKANLKCNPPLSEKDAKDKVKSAYSKKGEKGYRSLGCSDPLWASYYCGDQQRAECPIYTSQHLFKVVKPCKLKRVALKDETYYNLWVTAENNSSEPIEVRELSIKQLLNFNGCIRGKILDRCKSMFPTGKTSKEWESEIAPLFVEKLEEEEVPFDASFEGQIKLCFKEWVENKEKAAAEDDGEEISSCDLERRALLKDEKYYFRSKTLLDALQYTFSIKISSKRLWSILRTLEAYETRIRVGEDKNQTRLWVVPKKSLVELEEL